MISYANTDEIREIANDIRGLNKDLEEAFDALYKRLSEVPTVTGEWIGNKADFYFDTICQNEADHKSISASISALCDEMDRQAMSLDGIITEINQE